MKRIAPALAVLLLTGCAGQPAAAPAPVSPSSPVAAPAQAPAAPAASEPKVVTMPTPEEMCQKPADDSGIIIGLMSGPTDYEFGIRPGWTVPLYRQWFSVDLRFDKSVKVDHSSFRVKVEPDTWQPAEVNVINGADWAHHFRVLPEGKLKDGPPGWVTVTVTEGKDVSGKPLFNKPISFRIFMYDDLKVGETWTPCPVDESLIPPPVGGH